MTDKPKFGDAVNVPLSEMAARGIGPKTKLPDLGAYVYGMPLIEQTKHLLGGRPDRIVIDDAKKLRAKRGTGTYGNRDANARRKYLREYMQKRRALKKLLTEPSVLEKTDAV